MPVSDDYVTFTRDLLTDFEPLRIKRMFGGAGIYSGEFFFAILADDTLYLKVDEGNRAAFEQRGLARFTYQSKTGKSGSMSYYPVPADALEDGEALAPWVRGALEAAQRAVRKPVQTRTKDRKSGKSTSRSG